MDEAEAVKQMMMSCAICGESTAAVPAIALLTVRAPSGRTGAFAAHSACVIGVFHPKVSTPVENGTHHRLKMEHGAGAEP